MKRLPAEGPELPERWSVQRKMELVLRLLRGEALDAVSRESQVPAHELESWKRSFLEHGARGLMSRSDPEERKRTLALELADHLIEKEGFGWCWFFAAIDHHVDEIVSWHTAKLGGRWAASARTSPGG